MSTESKSIETKRAGSKIKMTYAEAMKKPIISDIFPPSEEEFMAFQRQFATETEILHWPIIPFKQYMNEPSDHANRITAQLVEAQQKRNALGENQPPLCISSLPMYVSACKLLFSFSATFRDFGKEDQKCSFSIFSFDDSKHIRRDFATPGADYSIRIGERVIGINDTRSCFLLVLDLDWEMINKVRVDEKPNYSKFDFSTMTVDDMIDFIPNFLRDNVIMGYTLATIKEQLCTKYLHPCKNYKYTEATPRDFDIINELNNLFFGKLENQQKRFDFYSYRPNYPLESKLMAHGSMSLYQIMEHCGIAPLVIESNSRLIGNIDKAVLSRIFQKYAWPNIIEVREPGNPSSIVYDPFLIPEIIAFFEDPFVIPEIIDFFKFNTSECSEQIGEKIMNLMIAFSQNFAKFKNMTIETMSEYLNVNVIDYYVPKWAISEVKKYLKKTMAPRIEKKSRMSWRLCHLVIDYVL